MLMFVRIMQQHKRLLSEKAQQTSFASFYFMCFDNMILNGLRIKKKIQQALCTKPKRKQVDFELRPPHEDTTQ